MPSHRRDVPRGEYPWMRRRLQRRVHSDEPVLGLESGLPRPRLRRRLRAPDALVCGEHSSARESHFILRDVFHAVVLDDLDAPRREHVEEYISRVRRVRRHELPPRHDRERREVFRPSRVFELLVQSVLHRERELDAAAAAADDDDVRLRVLLQHASHERFPPRAEPEYRFHRRRERGRARHRAGRRRDADVDAERVVANRRPRLQEHALVRRVDPDRLVVHEPVPRERAQRP
eukprot:30937-Pelagococcus_subviridis.AAC.23